MKVIKTPKSFSWKLYHADSAVVARGDLVYIVVYIDYHQDAGRGAVDGIKIVDDVMKAHAVSNSPNPENQPR